MRRLDASSNMLRGFVPWCATLLTAFHACAANPPAFKSAFFKTGTLIDSDDFDGETNKITPGRPVLQIGYHMILFNHLEVGGHRIKLPDGPSFSEPMSDLKLGEWIDLVIEYRKGEITIGVNDFSKTYKHKAVVIINKKNKLGPWSTFKGGPNGRIVFDSVRLWSCQE
ncbi:MAG: hypothetical protein AAF670_05240 [Planctomycetota bacterium]